MKTVLKNSLVTLCETDRNHWTIQHDHLSVGSMELSEMNGRPVLSFSILPAYQQHHYASNALFVLMPHLHQQRHLEQIFACCADANDMARHVLEHNGFARAEKSGDTLIYMHQNNVTARDDDWHPEGMHVLYFAGGCFWGTERIFQMLDGVVDTTTGYANGHTLNPTYEEVCRHDTGFRETVRVTYDPAVLPEETLMDAFFLCIDPAQYHRQGNDLGEQYQTGVYYKDEKLLPVLQKRFEEERKRYKKFYVELQPLQCFYEAEEYHQDYLMKNPDGYCHITRAELDAVKKLNREKQKDRQ